MIEEVLNNFNKVKIDNNPFSHKVINNIFPKDFYNDLIQNLPNKNQYIPINKTAVSAETKPDVGVAQAPSIKVLAISIIELPTEPL
mgnify:CR=1 FL=1